MKRLSFTAIIAILFVLNLAGLAQEKTIDRRPQTHMLSMLKDSTMMDMMMKQIAKDDHMRMMMLHKMMQSAKGEKGKMMEMCNAMVQDKDLHSTMMKMMETETQTTENVGLEILVKFKPDVDEAQINSMSAEIGLQQIKEIRELNLRVFKITSKKSLIDVIAHCQKEPFVEYAEPNQQFKTQKK